MRRVEWWRRPMVRCDDCLYISADSFAAAAAATAFAHNGNVFDGETKSWYANGINDDDDVDGDDAFLCTKNEYRNEKKNRNHFSHFSV